VKPSQAGGIALPCSCHPTQWDSADLDNGVWARVDEAEEPLGTKDKFWVQDTDGTRWLFKFARQKHGVVRGEDWAEWLVHGLANLMGVPTACIRPATSSGQRGIISRSVVESDQRLEHGNELLARINPAYDVKAARQNAGYTVDAIRMSLEGVGPPAARDDLKQLSGFDVWASYVVLDAWVAGRDRHHENWAAVRDDEARWLAPSFDHGNALGFQEPDANKADLAEHPDRLLTWAKRGRSHHFAGRPTLVAVAREALDLASPEAATLWQARLEGIQEPSVRQLLNRVPTDLLSVSSRRFCLNLLQLNRRRVLDGD
jgi:hypothetical protein